jgi:hypothetical protein
MSKVCLTAKQERWFNLFVKFHKENGSLPNPSQATALLRAEGIRCSSPSITQMYGTLFLKGAFNDGKPLTSTLRRIHATNNVDVFDASKAQFNPKPVVVGRAAAKAKGLATLGVKPVAANANPVANALLALLSDPNINAAFKAALNAGV